MIAQLGSPATASSFGSGWYGVTEGLGGRTNWHRALVCEDAGPEVVTLTDR